MTIGAGSTLLGMQQDGQNVIWTGVVDITAGVPSIPRLVISSVLQTGHDGRQPVPRRVQLRGQPHPGTASDDIDFERQWVRLGAVGPELRVKNIVMSDDHIAPGANIDIGYDGNWRQHFLTVQGRLLRWLSGEALDAVRVNGIDAGEMYPVSVVWESEDVTVSVPWLITRMKSPSQRR